MFVVLPSGGIEHLCSRDIPAKAGTTNIARRSTTDLPQRLIRQLANKDISEEQFASMVLEFDLVGSGDGR